MTGIPLQYRIIITENGPYQVTGGVPLIQRAPAMSVYGEPLEWDPVGAAVEKEEPRSAYRLCRCGQSKNKPFCDDLHLINGFVGPLTADRGPTALRRKTYTGTGVVLTDDVSLCASAGFCGLRFTKVWHMIRRTDDPEVRARLLSMVSHCPSGRLMVFSENGELIEPQFVPSIAAVRDGPYWVRGGISIEAPDGFVYEVRNRVTLCRCGNSKNMPFCDGTHEQIEFKAP